MWLRISDNCHLMILELIPEQLWNPKELVNTSNAKQLQLTALPKV